MTHSLIALFIGAGLAAIVYLATRFAIGGRADYLIGGAAPIAFFVSPWWAGLAGAILGHVLAVAVMRKLTKQKQPQFLAGFALIVFAAYAGMGIYHVNSVTTQVLAAITESSNKNWEVFSARSEANRFVLENYRPCIEAKSYTRMSVNSKHDPSLCRSSAVSLAASTRGHEYGKVVDAAINAWNAMKPIDPESERKIEKLIASIR